MFGIGGFELFIILLFGFLIFGPDKLPEIARTVGAAIGKFRKAQEEMNQVIKGEVLDPNAKSPSENRSSGRAREEQSAPAAPMKETFAQRKARYERERQAEQEHTRQQANRAAMRAEAAAGTQASTAGPGAAVSAGQASALTSVTQAANATDASSTSAVSATQRLNADELYGVAPRKPKPKAQVQSAATATDASVPAEPSEEREG